MFGNLSVTVIQCRDFEAMCAFYRDRLGMKVLQEQEGELILETVPGAGLILSAEGEKSVRLVFTEADIDRARDALGDAAPSEKHAHSTGEGFEVHDPDGNSVNFVNY